MRDGLYMNGGEERGGTEGSRVIVTGVAADVYEKEGVLKKAKSLKNYKDGKNGTERGPNIETDST